MIQRYRPFDLLDKAEQWVKTSDWSVLPWRHRLSGDDNQFKSC